MRLEVVLEASETVKEAETYEDCPIVTVVGRGGRKQDCGEEEKQGASHTAD